MARRGASHPELERPRGMRHRTGMPAWFRCVPSGVTAASSWKSQVQPCGQRPGGRLAYVDVSFGAAWVGVSLAEPGLGSPGRQVACNRREKGPSPEHGSSATAPSESRGSARQPRQGARPRKGVTPGVATGIRGPVRHRARGRRDPCRHILNGTRREAAGRRPRVRARPVRPGASPGRPRPQAAAAGARKPPSARPKVDRAACKTPAPAPRRGRAHPPRYRSVRRTVTRSSTTVLPSRIPTYGASSSARMRVAANAVR